MTDQTDVSDLAQAEELGAHVRDAFAALARRKGDLADDNARLLGELDALKARLAAADSDRLAQAGNANRLQGQLAQVGIDLEHARADGEQAKSQLRDTQAKRAALESENRQVSTKATELEHRVEHLAHDLEFAAAEAANLRLQISDAHAQRTTVEVERGQLASQLAQAQDRSQALVHELAQAQIEIDARTAREDARMRLEHELASDLARMLASDRSVAESANALAAAVEAHDPTDVGSDLGRRMRDAITALDKRKRDLSDESERMSAEIASLDQQLSISKDRAEGLVNERDEMAASGKEIIAQLTQQRDAREGDLREARARAETSEQRATELASRLSVSDSATRALAESIQRLADAAASTGDDGAQAIAGARMDLDLTLSQLPSDGETGIATRRDVPTQIAQGGKRLAEAVAVRHRGLAATLAQRSDELASQRERLQAAAQELSVIQETLAEREAGLRRNQSEIAAVRKEMAAQGAALAGKVQEVSSARSELASAKADYSAASDRIRTLESKAAESARDAASKDRDLQRTADELARASRRADDAEANQLRIAQALGSLTSWHAVAGAGGEFSDPIAKAAHKLELAKSIGGEEMSEAGRALVTAVQERVHALSDRLAEAQDQISASKVIEAQLSNDVAGLKAAMVDRDHSLANARTEIDRAKEDHAAALTTSMASRRDADETAAKLATASEQLRQALAELDGLRARGAAASGFTNEELVALREDVAAREAAAKQAERDLAELRERLEAADARMRRQREEFQRMLDERDQTIQQKDAQLDEVGAKRVDVNSLSAQVKALGDQLAAANERIQEFERLTGTHAGVSVKSGDLARELKRAQNERDGLRERKRQLESELADSVSSGAEMQTQLEEKRKEVQSLRDQFAKEVTEDREKSAAMREEFRKLKEEVVGLRARLKRLTEK
ncbi:MAG: hypothetical protein H0V44_12550 [Planctomycetes bacterium]|nr:hypothetical protein [Planctomycetota bacterium]